MNAEIIREQFIYSPLNGLLYWRVGNRKMKPLSVAGYKDTRGYIKVRYSGKIYYAHRLAWLYMTGEWPEGQIDHKNGIKNDNRWANLRDVTASLNQQNRLGPTQTNKSGVMGVTPTKWGYQAQIKFKGRNIYIGTYLSPEEAHSAYREKKRNIHAGCLL